jgi:hypothetical protein
MMQPTPFLMPLSASIGVEGEGSDSGTLEVVVKSEAKKSIGVGAYVIRGLKDVKKLSGGWRLTRRRLVLLCAANPTFGRVRTWSEENIR